MRKFLTALMAVLMIASAFAMLPTGAAEATTYDKTAASAANNLSLVITEFACETTSDTTGQETQNAFEFIEIYNRGSSGVSLYDLCLLRGENTTPGSIWRTSHGFNKQMFLAGGTDAIYNQSHVDASLYGSGTLSDTQTAFRKQYGIANPSSATLGAGKFAIIWFYSSQTAACAQQENRALTVDDFKQHWTKKGVTIPSGTLIIAVCAQGSKSFNLANGSDYMYAVADKSFNLTSDVAYSNTSGLNSKVKFLWDYGVSNAVGIPNNNGFTDRTALYVPANSKPDLYNAIEKSGLTAAELNDYVDATDYVQLGHSTSYKELALMNFNQDPTPGSMPDFQWVYVDPNRAPNKGTANWDKTAINNLIADSVETVEDAEQKEEIEQVIDLPDRSTLGNLGQNVQKTTKKSGGLDLWVIILIIVGGVLLVGGGVVVLLLVFKKKGKMQQADDDVATEGEIEIVDDTEVELEAEEAPAEEE